MTCTGHKLFIISTVYENKYTGGDTYVNNSEQILLPLYSLCVKLFPSHRLPLCVCVYVRLHPLQFLVFRTIWLVGYLQLLLSCECEFLLLLLVLVICLLQSHKCLRLSFSVLSDPAPEMHHNTLAYTCKCVSVCY